MPYLTDRRKKELENPKAPYLGAGDLTYGITRVVIDYTVTDGEQAFYTALEKCVSRYLPREPRYENFCVVMGALECATKEYIRRRPESFPKPLWLMSFSRRFYRDIVAPYEDEKIKVNGDVF